MKKLAFRSRCCCLFNPFNSKAYWELSSTSNVTVWLYLYLQEWQEAFQHLAGDRCYFRPLLVSVCFLLNRSCLFGCSSIQCNVNCPFAASSHSPLLSLDYPLMLFLASIHCFPNSLALFLQSHSLPSAPLLTSLRHEQMDLFPRQHENMLSFSNVISFWKPYANVTVEQEMAVDRVCAFCF